MTNYLNLEVNVDQLINRVKDHLNNIENYYKDPGVYSERGEYFGRKFIEELAEIMNLDERRIYSIARASRKWEKRHNWNRCFPTEEHAEQIMKYLQKDEWS